MDTRSNLAIKIDALQRLLMINLAGRALPLFIVTEYPKSGGTWIAQMIADYLGLPFPRNRRPDLRSCVMHGHMLPTPFMRNVAVVFRDGRDVMVSWYFHQLFENEHNAPVLVARTRRDLGFGDCHDVRANLPRFIDYVFERERRSLSPFHFTWPTFVRRWHGRQQPQVRYEDMVATPQDALSDLLEALTGVPTDVARSAQVIDKYSFKSQAQRSAGQENRSSFLRKGVPGDWQEKFTTASARLFEELAGPELRLLGYTRDASWIEEVA
jgi:hypothetical protein